MAIDKSRTISLSKFIYALGIRHVGEQCAILLAKHFASWESFYYNVTKARDKSSQEWADFSLIDGMGERTALSLVHYFSSKDSDWIISKLLKEISIDDFSASSANGVWSIKADTAFWRNTG